jgi:DNA-binding NtrC family response regulator
MEALLAVVERAIENRRNRQHQAIRNRGLTGVELDPFAGASPAITKLRETAQRAAEVDLPIILRGETGTGKGVLARWLHANSGRRAEPFVELNCAGIPRELAEAELFGYDRGAFTGATTPKIGLLEAAHLGTVLLDEIAEMDPVVQAKVLKVVEDGQARRLGGLELRQADVRLVAATHRDLRELVRSGKFREDLYYRLYRLELLLPPLRERKEDIPVLARSILRAVAVDLGCPPPVLPPEVERSLCKYTWPGNIRELRNVIERGVLLAKHDRLEFSAELFGAPEQLGTGSEDWDGLTLLQVERQHIERVLRREGNNIERTARRLGISRTTLYEKIKAFQIPRAG